MKLAAPGLASFIGSFLFGSLQLFVLATEQQQTFKYGHYELTNPQSHTITTNGCLYADLPSVYSLHSDQINESIDVDVNGIWKCSTRKNQDGQFVRDFCELSCNVGYGLAIDHLKDESSESGWVDKYFIKSKRIICNKKGLWVPAAGGDVMPRCHNVCGPMTLENIQDSESSETPEDDPKAKLICRNFGAINEKECTPGENCHHASTCYATCEDGFDKTNKPKESNEMQCICTQKKCGWNIPRDIVKLGKCSFQMNSEHRRIIGGYTQLNIKQTTRSQISAGLLQQDHNNGRRKKRSANENLIDHRRTKRNVSYKWQHICGGVLLTAQWAFSAAHCRTPGLRVLLGELDFERRTGDEVPCRVKLQIRHPQYDGQTKNDIMMINLQCRKLQMGEAIWPARLPQPMTEVPTGTDCEICGWGTMLYPEFKAATQLQCVNLPIMKTETCNQPYGGAIHDKIMCIGHGRGGQDSCQGDSGGGAYCNNICYGLVMGGLYCADANYPGVYTIVSKYVPWAVTVIRAYMAKQNTGGYNRKRGGNGRGKREITRQIPVMMKNYNR